jgi:hypothetical protein
MASRSGRPCGASDPQSMSVTIALLFGVGGWCLTSTSQEMQPIHGRHPVAPTGSDRVTIGTALRAR